MLYYGTQLLRVQGWNRTTIMLNKSSEKCGKHLFFIFSAANKSQGKKKNPLI